MADSRAGGSRSRFITWFLLATGAATLFLALCQRQKTLDKLDEWDYHLSSCGRVLVFSENPDLLETQSAAELVESADAPEILQLANGFDAASLSAALTDAGYGCVMVDPALDLRGSSSPLSTLTKLAAYRGWPDFRARMLTIDAGLFEPAAPLEIGDENLGALVTAVRAKLAGGEKAAIEQKAPAAVAQSREGGWDVAVQLSGLEPRQVRTARANVIRHDVYAAGKGETLVGAALDAAEKVATLFSQKHTAAEGPIDGAIERYRIELHVLTEFALLSHSEQTDTAQFAAFLDRAIAPGISGLSLNWAPLPEGRPPVAAGYRVRLPADAIYWSRPDGVRIAERLTTDAHLGKLEGLDSQPGIILDRFRSIHVIETTPGGDIVRVKRGRAIPAGGPPTVELMRTGVAKRLAADTGTDGTVSQSYYPVRDLHWLAKNAAYDPIQQGFAVEALRIASSRPGDSTIGDAATRALSRLLMDVHTCGGQEPWSAFVTGLDGNPRAVSQDHWSPACGPLDPQGRPTAVGTEGEPADPMAFVLLSRTASVEVTALALASLCAHPPPPLDEQGRDPHTSLIEAMVEFLLRMQDDDGGFGSHHVTGSHPRAGVQDPRAAPLALLALVRARSRIDDERIDEALRRGFANVVERMQIAADSQTDLSLRCRRLVVVAPLVTIAASEVESASGIDATDALLTGPRLLTDRCLLLTDDVLEPDLAGGYVDEPGQMPGADDLLAASSASLALAHLPPGSAARDLHAQAVALGIALAGRLVVVPSVSDHLMVIPEKALWGVGLDLNTHRQRPMSSFAALSLFASIP